MKGSDQTAITKDLHSPPNSHLRYAVAHSKILFAGQASANRVLTEPDPRGKVIGKLHVDILGGIPLRHMINARTPLTSGNAWLLL
jgi:hypothetical protein